MLSFVPLVLIFLIFVWFNYGLFRRNHSFPTKIEAALIDVRSKKDRVEVRGKLRNAGPHTWERVTVEAEFYDDKKVFLDETSQQIAAALTPGAEEHFRLTLITAEPGLIEALPTVVLKIADASEARY